MISKRTLNMMKKVQEIMGYNLVYLVGGAVRDEILGNEPKDYDFCTPLLPDEIENLIKSSGRKAYGVGKRFGTIKCKIDGEEIEITTFRNEEYFKRVSEEMYNFIEKNKDDIVDVDIIKLNLEKYTGRKPIVRFVKNIEEDLSRRDFTINAMAMRLLKNDNVETIDPFGGRKDLNAKIIRCVGNSKHRFKEDPLRILRAIRFATRFSFIIEDKTLDRIKKMKPLLLELSKERIVSEIDKILISPMTNYGLDLMFKYGLFKFIIPELDLQYMYNQNSKYHSHKLHEHTIKVICACPEDLNLRWSALLHDIAKPYLKTENINGYSNYIDHEKLGADMALRIANHLKFSKERRNFIVETIRDHLNEDSILKPYDNMGK